MNEVMLIGRFTADPTQRVTAGGTECCDFTIAINRPYSKTANEDKADFLQCTAWGKTAEFICKYFKKGQLAAIIGSLRTGSYQDKKYPDVTHYTTSVFVNRIEFCGNKKENDYKESDYEDILGNGETPF